MSLNNNPKYGQDPEGDFDEGEKIDWSTFKLSPDALLVLGLTPGVIFNELVEELENIEMAPGQEVFVGSFGKRGKVVVGTEARLSIDRIEAGVIYTSDGSSFDAQTKRLISGDTPGYHQQRTFITPTLGL